MALMPAFNLQAWIEENRHLLKPPVGNKCLYNGDFIVMIVGGPNQRTDYHWDEGPEFFYQLEGQAMLRIQEDGRMREITINEGEVFYLPPRIPHSPQRAAGSVGLVVERKRVEGEQDGLMWYCERCNHKLFEEFFPLRDIENDFPKVFEEFYRSKEHRTCDVCNYLNPAPAKYE
jgi:3-hydroxyanthranilate 3,4-dioxygenase